MTPLDDPRQLGDQYTFVALDPETKIVPAYRVGKRDLPTATAFITDLSERLANRVQLSSDALAAYVEATERAFGANVDYGQVVKFYEAEPVGRGRYSLNGQTAQAARPASPCRRYRERARWRAHH